MNQAIKNVGKVILDFIEKLYNSILYNGFYIFLSLLFPYVIYKLDAGHEIIENIVENEKVGLNISAILFAFFLLAFSVWCVPTLAIRLWKFFTGNKTDNYLLYKYLTVIYSGAGHTDENCTKDKITPHLQIPMKYFAVFPWMMFIFTCVWVLYKPWIYTAIAVLVLIGMFVAVDLFGKRIWELYNQWLFRKMQSQGKTMERMGTKKFLSRYSLFLIIFVAFICIPWLLDVFCGSFFLKVENGKQMLIGLNFLQLFAFYFFINFLEHLPSRIDPQQRYIISRFNYIFVIAIVLIIIVVLFIWNWKSEISIFNPIFVVVSLLAVFIMFFDICFTAQVLLTHIATVIRPSCEKKDACCIQDSSHNRLQFHRIFVNLCALLFIYLAFFHSTNEHRIREVESDATQSITDTRESLDAYFANWLKVNHDVTDGSDKNITIYLVSGPGGGSRAAAWFYLTMKKLDNLYQDQFYKSVFSISTVSGSTSGANMYLAEKHLGITREYSSLQLATDIYSKNYFSGTFFGLLLGDGAEGMAGIITRQTKGRNYYFQKEEMNGFIEAYGLTGTDAAKARAYFENDMLDAYRDKALPLFFINTTLIECGKRGIFSPVKIGNGTEKFSIGVDLYDRYIHFLEYTKPENRCRKDSLKILRGIPMVTCVNQSQAFPLINSYDYLDGAGRLCDGGLYDNSGCSTTLEIYQALRKYIKKHELKNIKIVCLNILNGDINDNFEFGCKAPSILNTLQGVASLPFSGNETYAFFNLERQIKNHIITAECNGVKINDAVINLQPTNKYNLTRMLSKDAIKAIDDEVFKAVFDKKEAFEKVTVKAENIRVTESVKTAIEMNSAPVQTDSVRVME